MDQDDFNDFEQAPSSTQPQPPSTQTTTPETHTSPPTVDNPLVVIPQQPSLQPSFSMLTNNESQPTFDLNLNGWEGVPQPSLGKTESEHGVNIEAITLEFGKRNSEREAANELIEGAHGSEEVGQVREVNNVVSDQATINTQQPIDLEFEQFRSSKLQTGSMQPVGIQSDHSSPIHSKNQEKNLNDHTKNRDEPEIWEDQKEQPRKESQQFGDFGEAKQQEPVQQQIRQVQLIQQIQVIQTQIATQIAQSVITQETVQPPYNQNIESQVKPQENSASMQIKPEMVQDDDDEFGDFEQTVQVPIESQPEPQVYQVNGVNESQVKIDETKAPYGIQTSSKEKYLQDFVDSLPDYSFLLSKAFNSL